jgi:hypothetical protein
MRANRSGLVVLTLVQVATVLSVFGFQWNDTHVFDPEWHPHARFHIVQLMGFVTVVAVLSLWLLWRRSSEPLVGVTVATVAPLAFWAGEFYAQLVPGTSPAYDPRHPNTVELDGITVYGNLLFAGLMIVLAVVGFSLVLRGVRQKHRSGVE